ncbi:serine/threonine-protein kinase [Streptomyces sp. NPDC001093]|uniref:serine/threonine-protein kinase n=1 Tax=Streptomyces sp. NPDC001093 TaxID=3154376 RepID=UPI00332C71C0
MHELGENDPRECGGYQLLGRLGAGGMGVVYLGRHANGQKAAVKIMRPELADDAAFVERFRREGRALAALRSPYVVTVLKHSGENERSYLVTEYVPGSSLAERLGAGPIAPGELLSLAEALAQALEAIHAAGIVHRDLKPSNVLLGPDGPKVIDFGIAQLFDATAVTRTGWRLGTPGYLAPEQLTAGVAGMAADVFAWGLVVASAALGRHPFGVGPAEGLAYRIQRHEPDLRGLPSELVPAVRSALQKDPKQRPDGAQLIQLLREPPPLTAPYTLAVPPSGPATRPQWTFLRKALLTALLSAVVSVGLVVWLLTQGKATGSVIASSDGRSGHVRMTASTSAAPSAVGARSATTSPPSMTAKADETPKAAPSTPAATQVLTFTPWTFGEPADDIDVVSTVRGSCFGQSLAIVRSDAYRCVVGHEIKDPCFSPPNDLAPAVLCPEAGPIGKVIRVDLTEKLPDDVGLEDQPFPFKITLADGQVCDSYEGSGIAIAGKTMTFACPDGDLFGGPDPAGSTWTINYRPKGAGSFQPVDVAAVYE